jgi:hypothetical protein
MITRSNTSNRKQQKSHAAKNNLWLQYLNALKQQQKTKNDETAMKSFSFRCQ